MKDNKDWRVITPYGFIYDFPTRPEAEEFALKHGFIFDGPIRGSKSWWEQQEKAAQEIAKKLAQGHASGPGGSSRRELAGGSEGLGADMKKSGGVKCHVWGRN